MGMKPCTLSLNVHSNIPGDAVLFGDMIKLLEPWAVMICGCLLYVQYEFSAQNHGSSSIQFGPVRCACNADFTC